MESLLTSLTPPMLELLFISYAIFINNVLTLRTHIYLPGFHCLMLPLKVSGSLSRWSHQPIAQGNNFSGSLSPPCCCLLKISFVLRPVSVKLPWQMFHVLSSHRDPRDPQKCQLELCSRWSCAIWPCGQCHLATKVVLLLCPIPNSAFKPTGSFILTHPVIFPSDYRLTTLHICLLPSVWVGTLGKDHMAGFVLFFLNSSHPQMHLAS